MTIQRLTLDSAKKMPFEDLLESAKDLVDKYSVHEGQDETEEQYMARIEKGLDELPAIYGFLLQLHHMFDHWADFYYAQHGGKSLEYKGYRQKRDAMENMARYAKLRYEGTSRILTRKLDQHAAANMPSGRG